MIKAFIFDLDGTLVMTEIMKATSHAKATVQLSPVPLTEEQVLAQSGDLYGISEPATAKLLIERFDLEETIRARMDKLGGKTPPEAFLLLQRAIYMDMIQDGEAVRREQMNDAVGLLQWARASGYRTALATMSYRDQAETVLQALGLRESFEVVVTEDDVRQGKPDPEAYLTVAQRMRLPTEQCLVIEDTLAGVRAALAAGMRCIAVPSSLTREEVHAGGALEERWIVDDTGRLLETVQGLLRSTGTAD